MKMALAIAAMLYGCGVPMTGGDGGDGGGPTDADGGACTALDYGRCSGDGGSVCDPNSQGPYCFSGACRAPCVSATDPACGTSGGECVASGETTCDTAHHCTAVYVCVPLVSANCH